MPTLKVRLVCEVDGEVVHDGEIGSDLIASLVSSIPESEDNADLLGYMALSPSCEVRQNVAYKDHLKEETIALLAADNSVEVLRNICSRDAFKHWATEEVLFKLIKHDVECAKNIASSVGEYSNVEANRVTVELCKHPDPGVRQRLADTYSTPKVVVKRLTQDVDSGVRAAAKKTLNNN